MFARKILDRVHGGTVPDGWSLSLLDELAKRGSGHTPDKEVPEYWNGDIKWLSLKDSNRLDSGLVNDTEDYISELGIRHSSAVKHPAGCVVLLRDAAVGKSAITGCDMAVSQHFLAWKCGQELENTYLYYWFQLMKPEFERIANGSTIKTIGLGYFNKLELLAPDLQIQRRIVAVLSVWDRGIEEAERLLALKEQRKRALMQQLLTGKRRFPEFVRSKARIRTMFGTAPKDWPLRRFGDFLQESRQRGSDGESARKITVKLYGKGVIPKSEKRIGSESTQYFRRSQGQFIYSKLDFLNGAFGLVPNELDGYESTLDLPAFDIAPALDSTFLLSFVTRPDFYTRCIGYAMGGRKARRVPPEQFLSIEFPCPSLEEQRRIAAVLNACDNELRHLRDEVATLKQQKNGLMQKLLTGQVRVPKTFGLDKL